MANEWRRYIYLGVGGLGIDCHIFAVPTPAAPGVPGRGYEVRVPVRFEEDGYDHSHSCDCGEATAERFCSHMLQGREAARYWQLRESWRTQTTEEVEALYAKWLPKRDAVLAKEEHLGKARADWERFYLALADEVAARQYASGKVSLDFGLDGQALLKAMQLGGRAG